MTASTAQRALWGSVGGYTTRAKHSPSDYTATARETFLKGFEKLVDPDGKLDPKERAIRAEAMKRAHMRQLAIKSAKARAVRSRGRRSDLRASDGQPDAL